MGTQQALTTFQAEVLSVLHYKEKTGIEGEIDWESFDWDEDDVYETMDILRYYKYLAPEGFDDDDDCPTLTIDGEQYLLLLNDELEKLDLLSEKAETLNIENKISKTEVLQNDTDIKVININFNIRPSFSLANIDNNESGVGSVLRWIFEGRERIPEILKGHMKK